MPSRYHPIEDGLWNDPKFDACGDLQDAPGDERGFFAFLSTNALQRPAGIYRATDAQLASVYHWPAARVTKTLAVLVKRRLIVRDGAWIFTPGYLKRQPGNPGFLKAARRTVESCSSMIILQSFLEHYPLHKEWLPNGWQTVQEPITQNAPTVPEQYQSSTRAKELSVGSKNEPTVFLQCWKLHPYGPKKDALKAFKAANIPDNVVVILQAQLEHKAQMDKAGKFCPELPHLCRWFAKQRWLDVIPTNGNATPTQDPKSSWKSQADYIAAVAAGRVHPKRRIPEWETPLSSVASATNQSNHPGGAPTA